MRLFVAVDPSAQTRAHLADALERLPRDARLRFTDPATWHVTLAFLGEVDASTAGALESALAETARRAAPVELRLEGCGSFGGRGGAALWVGVVGELAPLAAEVRAAARSHGIRLDDGPFRPHLTIARTRGTRPPAEHLAAYSSPPWVADEMKLVRSHLGRPLRHTPVGVWSLDG